MSNLACGYIEINEADCSNEVAITPLVCEKHSHLRCVYCGNQALKTYTLDARTDKVTRTCSSFNCDLYHLYNNHGNYLSLICLTEIYAKVEPLRVLVALTDDNTAKSGFLVPDRNNLTFRWSTIHIGDDVFDLAETIKFFDSLLKEDKRSIIIYSNQIKTDILSKMELVKIESEASILI